MPPTPLKTSDHNCNVSGDFEQSCGMEAVVEQTAANIPSISIKKIKSSVMIIFQVYRYLKLI